MIGTGSRVKVRESDYDPASGITGVVDIVDASQVPFHVKFDTPRHGVDSSWFEAKVLVELGGSKRTADELETLIEGFSYVYNPIDDTDYQAGTRRWEAYANRIEAGGEVNDEYTAYFGYEDELLDMEQEPLVRLIKTEIDRANQWYKEHVEQE